MEKTQNSPSKRRLWLPRYQNLILGWVSEAAVAVIGCLSCSERGCGHAIMEGLKSYDKNETELGAQSQNKITARLVDCHI
jgi:hypothetical protein